MGHLAIGVHEAQEVPTVLQAHAATVAPYDHEFARLQLPGERVCPIESGNAVGVEVQRYVAPVLESPILE